MTDLSKQLLEKAHGGLKLNPDEQDAISELSRKEFLDTDISTANSSELEHGFFSILETFRKSRGTFCEDFTKYRV